MSTYLFLVFAILVGWLMALDLRDLIRTRVARRRRRMRGW